MKSTRLNSLLGVLLYLLLGGPVWPWLWGEWLNNSYYSHGLLLAPVALYLVGWQLWQQQPQPGKGQSRGIVVLALAILVYSLALSQRAYYVAAIALVGVLAGLVWSLWGGAMVRRLALPFCLLGLTVPLPLVEAATLPMALWTGNYAARLARLFGLELTVVGNAILLPNAELVVGAQCSGMNSLISLFSLTVLLAYLVKGSWWGRGTLVLMTFPLAVLGNLLRVANLLFVARYWGADASFVFYHDVSGPLFFLVMMLILYPLTRWLQCHQLDYKRFLPA